MNSFLFTSDPISFYKQLGLLATMCFILYLLTLNGSFHFDIHSPNVKRFLWSFSDSLIVFTTQNNLVSSANLAIPLSTKWFQVIYKYVKKALILDRTLGDPTSYLSSLWEMTIYFYSSFSILYPIAYLQEGLSFYSMLLNLFRINLWLCWSLYYCDFKQQPNFLESDCPFGFLFEFSFHQSIQFWEFPFFEVKYNYAELAM